jgi:hypothetical protein
MYRTLMGYSYQCIRVVLGLLVIKSGRTSLWLLCLLIRVLNELVFAGRSGELPNFGYWLGGLLFEYCFLWYFFLGLGGCED